MNAPTPTVKRQPTQLSIVNFKIIDLGLIDYKKAYESQLEIVQKVIDGQQEDTLLLCHHPAVVTLGKKSKESDLTGWSGDVYSIERGGQATYHGPGQSVVYPILNLKRFNQNISGFLESMEQAMMETLESYQITSSGNPDRGCPDYTGVWTNEKKIASIGVAIKRWVTYHGLAINLYHDPLAFQGINPCGFNASIMTNMEQELGGVKVDRQEFQNKLMTNLIKRFQNL